jgi:2-polyprenyl-6-hydroxyphenyl methylase/3-demethylubiquinone-9 3-methyltransferase
MSETLDRYHDEVRSGARFRFGRNWARFLRKLNEQRITLAVDSLRNMLGEERLDGKTFLDIGSGSGLFSLAARRLGAWVLSFDYDPESVACTATLRQRYYPNSSEWTVERGSVLDRDYLSRIGEFDIVYSWGVLHHTGNMWQAFENVKALVKRSGKLFIAVYNDLGAVTDRWEEVKRTYNALPHVFRLPYALKIIVREEWPQVRNAFLQGDFGVWLDQWRNYGERSARGMSRWVDWVDWIGGYPYERATLEQVVDHFARDGFRLVKLVDRSGGYGCNEFVFRRDAPMGTWVESRIPGGVSFVRRYGWRVSGPFEKVGSGFFGTAQSIAGNSPWTEWVVFRNGKLAGRTERDAHGRFRVALSADPPAAGDVFVVAAARIVDAREPFIHSRGKLWSWYVPELESVADNTDPAKRSPVFVFEGGVQLPYPHALHEDIAQAGGGRFSHWGRYVFFSTLSGGDPNADPSRFKLLVALDHGDVPVTGAY